MDIQNIIALDKAYYMNTFGDRIPLVFTHGKGCTLYDQDGNAYLDFLAGIAVNALGYAHETYTQAMQEQVGKILHYSNYFYNEKQALLAQMLCENSCADKVFLANTGAEANEAAIKLVRKYFSAKGERRNEIITTENSFHGRTTATVAATGQPKYSAPFQPMPMGFVSVPYGNIEAVKAAINENTCAVMLECIQGEGGIIEGGKEYLQALRTLCDETGILLMLDEVQTGMGRTGALFAHQLYDVEPDIFTLAKALGNGFPVGAVLCKDKYNAFAPGEHGSTFGGNVLACTAALATLNALLQPGFLSDVASKGEAFKQALVDLKADCPAILDVRGRGLIIGLQINASIPAGAVQRKLLGRGFIVGTAGNNTLRFVPPLIITKDELFSVLAPLKDELNNFKQEK